VELTEREIRELRSRAQTVRQHIVRMVASAGAGHPGGSLSAADIIVTLFGKVMRVDPARPAWPERDRFILSKGHAAPALYATLAELGYFSLDHLLTFDHIDSILQGHPDMTKTPGVDMSSGSLGQGLSVGVGMALGARVLHHDFRTYVLLGDGELQEGQVWEAAMLASKYHLNNLTAIVDANCLQLAGQTSVIMPTCEPYGPKWAAFGWNVLEADGHDIPAIAAALGRARAYGDGPTIIVAHTVKGKGVSFMEHNVAWHSRALTPEELTRALQDLAAEGGQRP